MKKLSLTLDALHVESFESSVADLAERGTVKGHQEAIAGASMSYCQSCFSEGDLCKPLTSYRCA